MKLTSRDSFSVPSGAHKWPQSFDRATARAYDAMCLEQLGIPGIVLMENAASACADIALRMLGARNQPTRVAVLCGTGQNGGDGYAIARHLSNAGCVVDIFSLGPPAPQSDAFVNAQITRALNIPVQPLHAHTLLASFALVIDALWGTGLDRPLCEHDQAIINNINSSQRPVLCVDLPSGMNADSGAPMPVCVHATITVTMVAPKIGFAAANAAHFVGRLEIASIGAPMPHQHH